MATTNVTITTSWSEFHSTTEEIDVSCNDLDWYLYLGTSTPAASVVGGKMKANQKYNITPSGSDTFYGRCTKNSGVLAIG